MKVWFEITIAGSIYSLSIIIVLLRLFQVTEISDLSSHVDFLPYLSIVFVVVSYLVGIISHRFLQLFSGPFFRLLERVFRLKNLSNIYSVEGHYEKTVTIWLHGSERIHKELDFQFSLQALFRSLIFSFLALTAALCLYLGWLISYCLLYIIVPTGIFLSIVCFIVYRRQRQNLTKLVTVAVSKLDQLDTLQELAPD